MRVLLYILLGAVLLFVLYVLAGFAYTIYRIATGKMPQEEYKRNLKIYAERKQKRKEKHNAKQKTDSPSDSKPDGFDTFMFN